MLINVHIAVGMLLRFKVSFDEVLEKNAPRQSRGAKFHVVGD